MKKQPICSNRTDNADTKHFKGGVYDANEQRSSIAKIFRFFHFKKMGKKPQCVL